MSTNNLYVAASGGSDLGTGSYTDPLATIAGAITRGRGLDVMSSLTINALPGTHRGGDYRFVASDSGVQMLGLGDLGDVILSASSVLSGWVDIGGGIHRAPYVGQPGAVTTLFEDGVRGRPARSPKLNPGVSFPCSQAPYKLTAGTVGSYVQVEYTIGDYDPTTWVMQRAKMFLWSGGDVLPGIDWFSDTIPLGSVDAILRLLNLTQQSRYSIGVGCRYFIQNVQAFLTEPGEFFYDGANVYYMFRGDPTTAQVEIPDRYDLVALRGTSTEYVADVSIRNMVMGSTAFPVWYRHAHVLDGEGYTDRDRGPLDALATSAPYDRQMTMLIDRHGVINSMNADALQLENVHAIGGGLHNLYFSGANLDHSLTNVWSEQAGHSTLYADGLYPGGGDLSRGWTIHNFKSNNSGQMVGNGGGMLLINSGHHSISNFEFADGPRNGFFIGAYTDIPAGNCYTEGTVLELGRFTNFCQDSGDCGVIGLGGLSSINGGPVLTNTIRQVIVDGANAHPSMLDEAPNGVFTDNQSWGQVFENVQVLNTQGDQFRINDSGGHTYTNTSFLSTGLPNPAFNPALMSPDIGLTAEWPF